MHGSLICKRLFVLVLAGLATSGTWGAAEEPTITVSGEAEVKVVPDIVTIDVGIEARAKTVAAATEESDKKLKSMLEFFKTSGIEDKHIRTEFITIDPIFREDRQSYSKGQIQQNNANADPFGGPGDGAEVVAALEPIGYLAGRQLSITIVDLKKFETIYKGLIERGINRARGIHFSSSQLNKLRDTVRLDAVRNAREKAKAMARELGATLASIKTMREVGQSGFFAARTGLPGSDPFGDSESSIGLAAGEMAVKSSVELVFVLGNTDLRP